MHHAHAHFSHRMSLCVTYVFETSYFNNNNNNKCPDIRRLYDEVSLLQVYVEKGEFELAKQYCRDNPAHIDQVLVKQADMYFSNKEYVKWHL